MTRLLRYWHREADPRTPKRDTDLAATNRRFRPRLAKRTWTMELRGNARW